MEIDEITKLDVTDDFNFAIVVGSHEWRPEGKIEFYTHCAIVYSDLENNIKVIQFWNRSINNNFPFSELLKQDYVYVGYNKDVIFDEYAQNLAVMCDLVSERNSIIEYGFYFMNSTFDDNGKLIRSSDEIGLNCSTLILAIFDKVGIPLIRITDWKERDEDRSYHEKAKNEILQDPDVNQNDELIQHYEKNISCFRYRPEEVAAASSSSLLPVGFDYCESKGKEVKDALMNGMEYYQIMYGQD